MTGGFTRRAAPPFAWETSTKWFVLVIASARNDEEPVRGKCNIAEIAE